MDLMELAGADWKSMPHDELYDAVIDALGGPDAFRAMLPFQDTDVLYAKYLEDEHFNNRDAYSPHIGAWDHAAGYGLSRKPFQPPNYAPVPGPMWDLLHAHGVTWSTCSWNVCLLKRAAVRLLMAHGYFSPEAANDA